MKIESTIRHQSGQVFLATYTDINDKTDLNGKKIKSVHAYCFYNHQLVLVYSDKKGFWTPPGGNVEEGEDIEAAVRREVKEETNMKVLKHCFIGYLDVTKPNCVISQTRSVCLVEPYGPFVDDPDGDITKIELIDPHDYKKYFDWGVIGDHIMQRALELKVQMELEENVLNN